MKLPASSRSPRKGFTLVELFIVGALIALFSTLAIFGIQQQFDSNIRKAAIGEARQIGSALDFASLDTSVFPRLCWLTESTQGMDFISALLGQPNSQVPFQFLDYNGRPLGPGGASVRTNWDGPYFALSQSRTGISQGRTGIVRVFLPELSSFGGGTPNEDGLRWPGDPWSNPYVVYMLDLDVSSPSSARLRFVNDGIVDENSATNGTIKGSYINAVVSYGKNLAPGGLEDNRPFGDPGSPGNVGDGVYRFRLFTGNPSRGEFEMLTAQDFQTRATPLGSPTNAALANDRAQIWSREFAGDNGQNLQTGGDIPLGPDPDTPTNDVLLGIADPGSDDIVFEF